MMRRSQIMRRGNKPQIAQISLIRREGVQRSRFAVHRSTFGGEVRTHRATGHFFHGKFAKVNDRLFNLMNR
jgi:hypothetical protein